MSIKVMSRCWDTPCGSHTKKLVLLALADNANDGGECFPSMETIARKCDLSEQAVRNWIKEMEEEKWLVVDRSHKLKRSNIYTLTPPTPLTPNAVDPQQGLPQPPTPLTLTPNAVDPNRQGTVKEPSKGNGELPTEAIFWNKTCRALPHVLNCGSSRMRHLKTRRSDPFWVANFEAAVLKATDSDFCNGKNDRGWRATFDWLIGQSDVVAKIMEGKYDNRVTSQSGNGDSHGFGFCQL